MNNDLEEYLENRYSSIKENINYINSDNINSSTFLNNHGDKDLSNIKEYKEELIDFDFKDNSLISYYDSFYS